MAENNLSQTIDEKVDFRDKANNFLMKDNALIVFMMLACAGAFAGTHIFLKYHTGSFSTTSVTVMLKGALDKENYSALLGFTGGFLLARILEGPLVGILDIGGSIMTGVATGLPALFLSMGYNIVLDNFLLSILVGACIGFVLSVIILIVRKFMPKGYGSLGTDVMMGAGNIIGEWFGPIIMLAALKYNFVAGLGSIIGGAICHEKGKPLIGGAILGAMIFGWIFSLIF